MAYNSYFPATYQPQYFGGNPYYQQMQQQQMMQQQAQQQQPQQTAQVQQSPSIQQSGFVLVQSEQEARSYPVAPGNSVTFKDENAPFCYVKTMGFSQLDRPTFERYRLVKEDTPETAQKSPVSNDSTNKTNDVDFATKTDVDEIWRELDGIKKTVKGYVDELIALDGKIKAQAEKKTVKARKVTVREDDEDDE